MGAREAEQKRRARLIPDVGEVEPPRPARSSSDDGARELLHGRTPVRLHRSRRGRAPMRTFSSGWRPAGALLAYFGAKAAGG
jgi:hypothetical protein